MSSSTRPSRKTTIAFVLSALFAQAPAAHAEITSPVVTINEAVASSEVTLAPLRRNVSLIDGSGGNITVLQGPEGKLMIDGGIAVSRPKVLSVLDRLGPGPVRYVINTHYHWDHTDGDAWLHEAGATVVAHENTLKRLQSGTRVIDWSFTFRPVAQAGLPTEVFARDRTIAFGDETVVLRHPGPGHTDTDVVAYFEKANVLAVGDVWWNGFYPFIDYTAGGSIDGVIREVDLCIRAAKADTIIVPGHGPVGTRAELIAFRDMLVTIRANVARLKHQGKTLAETIAAKPTAAYDAKYGQFLIDPAFFTHLVYMGV